MSEDAAVPPMGPGAPPTLALVGPTASGKTALSLAVAERLGGEIISMDSRQVYRGLDVGTAKATAAERARVPHHGLDLVEPSERFSAGAFARYARAAIAAIGARGRLPLLVGGTGFFLRALTHPIFAEPPLPPERRAALRERLSALSEEELLRWLQALDAEAAQRLQRWGGRQRLLRALELPLLTGRPLSWWQRHAPPAEPPLRPLVFALELPRERLNAQIDARVEQMVAAGLLDEVRRLYAQGYAERSPGMNAQGYVELLPHLRGERTLDEALALVRRHTRHYARRQVTWFRHQLPPDALRLDATRPRTELAEEIGRRWDEFMRAAADRARRSLTPDPRPLRS